MGWVLRTEDVSGFSPSPRNGRGSTPGQDGLTVEQPVDPGGLDRLWKSLRWQEVEDGYCWKKRWPELGRLRTVHSVWGSMVVFLGGVTLTGYGIYSWRYVWSYLHRCGSILTVMHPLYQEVSCIHQRTHPHVSHVNCVGWNSFALYTFSCCMCLKISILATCTHGCQYMARRDLGILGLRGASQGSWEMQKLQQSPYQGKAEKWPNQTQLNTFRS